MYFAAGSLYNAQVHGKRGWDVIPHIGLFRRMKQGIASCCKDMTARRQGYDDGILDGAIGRDEEEVPEYTQMPPPPAPGTGSYDDL